MELYYDEVATPFGWLPILTNQQALVYVGGFNQPLEWDLLQAFAPNEIHLLKNPKKTQPFRHAFVNYFSQQITQFSIPVAFLTGTSFQQAVWTGLMTIPFGTTLSYSQFAQQLGRPKAVRAVASAIGRNPIAIVVPCHRIVSKDGKLGGFRGGLVMKQQLLIHEGILGRKME